MSQNQPEVEKCGETTKAGTPCQLPNDSCPHHGEGTTVEDGESAPTEQSAPSEQAFEELGSFIEDEMDLNGAEGDSSKTTAAKHFIKVGEADNREMYRTMFGDCEAANCSNGANGFEKDYCRSCEAKEDSNDEGSTEGEETITIEVNGNEVTGTKDEVLELLK